MVLTVAEENNNNISIESDTNISIILVHLCCFLIIMAIQDDPFYNVLQSLMS
jgi:hypothetical protein